MQDQEDGVGRGREGRKRLANFLVLSRHSGMYPEFDRSLELWRVMKKLGDGLTTVPPSVDISVHDLGPFDRGSER